MNFMVYDKVVWVWDMRTLNVFFVHLRMKVCRLGALCSLNDLFGGFSFKSSPTDSWSCRVVINRPQVPYLIYTRTVNRVYCNFKLIISVCRTGEIQGG
jgi:hypothetical protein